jgi:hypothetical protein
VDFAELVAEYEAASGKKLKVERLGSIQGRLETLMNGRYLSIRPATVRDYVAKEGL